MERDKKNTIAGVQWVLMLFPPGKEFPKGFLLALCYHLCAACITPMNKHSLNAFPDLLKFNILLGRLFLPPPTPTLGF